jgi:uncharacterized protein YhbP (UPF0306 family)
MEPKKLILDHLKDVHVMQLATAQNNQPWVCNVHFYADENLNLYWLSEPGRRHSKDIAANTKAAVAILVSEEIPLVGVQLEGDAEMCTGSEYATVLRAYGERHNRADWAQDVIDGKGNNKLYKFTPRVLGLFDLKNFPKDPKQEWRV